MNRNVIRCAGCGVEIQTTMPGVTGYVPKIINRNGAVFCQRCFRLQHYGINNDDSIFTPNYEEILEKAVKKNNLIIYVVDLFNFEGSIITDAHKVISNNPVLIVANKRDILPKVINDEKLKEFVYQNLIKKGVSPKGIIISSAYKNYNLDEIFEAMNSLRNNGDVYIIGASSVGKSSIINAIMKSYKNESRNMISTSPYPGTTVSTITIPLDNKSNLIDTPGAMVNDSALSRLEKNTLKYIIPRTEMKPITIVVGEKQSIFLGGLVRIDVLEGNKSSYTFYVSNDVDVHHVKLDKADASFDSLICKNKIKPISTLISGSESLIAHSFNIEDNKSVDLVISGIGWINIKGKGQKITLKTLKGIKVLLREPEI